MWTGLAASCYNCHRCHPDRDDDGANGPTNHQPAATSGHFVGVVGDHDPTVSKERSCQLLGRLRVFCPLARPALSSRLAIHQALLQIFPIIGHLSDTRL